jgi:hypothetical protein
MNSTPDAHRDIALLTLNRPGATTEDLLRAICHAVLAGHRGPLHVDAFNPDLQLNTDHLNQTKEIE